MRRPLIAALAVAGLAAWATPAQAQLFGPRYTVRYQRDGDIVVRGRGIGPVVVDPYVSTVATYPTTYVSSPVVTRSYVASSPVVATSYVTDAPVVATTRVYAPTSAVVVSRPIATPTVSYVPTVSYLPTTVVSPAYVPTTRVIASPYVSTSYTPLFPTTAVAYPWP